MSVGSMQCVVINGKSSSWGNVINEVPQSSVLGPLLSLIYMNDIDNNLCLKYVNFLTIQK